MATLREEEGKAGVARCSHERYQLGGIHNSLSQSIDLAKLNPNCHTNYSNYL